MARGRFLSESIAKDKRLNELSIEAELVYLMTIPHLDRDGLIDGDPDVLWGTVCPKRRAFIDAMPELIGEWVGSELVIRYDTPDGPVLWFVGFAKNQQGMRYDRESGSQYPPPPGYVREASGLVPQDYESLRAQNPACVRQNSGNPPEASGNCRAEVEGQVEGQVEVEVEVEVEAATPPSAAAAESPAWQAYTENMPGTITPVIADQVNALIDDYGDRDVYRAIVIACERNRRTLGYVKGILQKGIDTTAPARSKAEANDAVFAKMRERIANNGRTNGSGNHVQQLPQRAG